MAGQESKTTQSRSTQGMNLYSQIRKYYNYIDGLMGTLDHCYSVLMNAYRSVPRVALGLSDHCLVYLLPSRQKLKSAKPVVKTVRKWTNESKLELQGCFDCTDWSVFEAASTSLIKLTDTVTSYISFCEKHVCTHQNFLHL